MKSFLKANQIVIKNKKKACLVEDAKLKVTIGTIHIKKVVNLQQSVWEAVQVQAK